MEQDAGYDDVIWLVSIEVESNYLNSEKESLLSSMVGKVLHEVVHLLVKHVKHHWTNL